MRLSVIIFEVNPLYRAIDGHASASGSTSRVERSASSASGLILCHSSRQISSGGLFLGR